MIGRTLMIVAACAVSAVAASPALADRCRSLEMRVMQLQAGGERNQGEIAAIRGVLSQQGCGGGGARVAIPSEGNIFRYQPREGQARWAPNWSFGRAIEPGKVVPSVARLAPASRSRAEPTPGRGSTYKTLCVRKCDGYYFPISFSTTSEHFPADEATCATMCPAGDAALFTLPNRAFGPEAMRSLDGDPYMALENALRYRTAIDASCTCTVSPAGGVTYARAGYVRAPEAPAPQPRPQPGEDPETLQNRIGGFTPAAPAAPVAAVTMSDKEAVRVVLPSWNAGLSDVIVGPVPN
jgi:hypothetical protein